MADTLAVAVLLALVVEGAHWIRFRWDFDDESCGRAWQFTSIGIGLATIFIWLEGNPYYAFPRLLTWLPPLLLPMQFVQSYGTRNWMPLHTFSFFAKQRRKRNLRHGLTDTPIHVNFGNIYFATPIVAATLGPRSNVNDWSFLGGIILLTFWLFVGTRRTRLRALIPAMGVAAAIAVTGQIGLKKAVDWITSGGSGSSGETKGFDPNLASTLIGRPGKIYQSPDIIWRLATVGKSPIPKLLRTASYTNYRQSVWENIRTAETDFADLDSREGPGGLPYYILRKNTGIESISEKLPRFTIRGTAPAETPLPLPGTATSLRDFALDGVDLNSFGTVRVFPKEPVIDGLVLWQGATNPETPPWLYEDLKTPLPERAALKKILTELDLDAEPTLRNKLEKIRFWFAKNFTYSRDLTITSSRIVTTTPTALTQFLTKTKSGHCEYFATAATLLLRESGIPARYTTGYAVMERDFDRKEYVIRGTHGHAWCRVWDQDVKQWFDFDVTPPSWLPAATPENTWKQRFNDDFKRTREDFFIWRNRPQNRLAVSAAMALLALGVIGFVAKRLWHSKRRLANLESFSSSKGPLVRTPLHDLEPQLRKRLGPRPPGQTFAAWLLQIRPLLGDATLLEEAVKLHQRLRYDPAPALPADHDRLKKITGKLARLLLHRRD